MICVLTSRRVHKRCEGATRDTLVQIQAPLQSGVHPTAEPQLAMGIFVLFFLANSRDSASLLNFSILYALTTVLHFVTLYT